MKFINVQVPNRPHFYHLKKILKTLEQPPGRPIISGINIFTSNLSHYVDIYFQDHVKKQSYFRDLYDLIKILNVTLLGNISFLTLDVTSFYTNIHLGMKCVDETLKQDDGITDKAFLVNSVKFILENNYFTFRDDIYKPRKGTAKATRVAPSYANLFLGSFKL